MIFGYFCTCELAVCILVGLCMRVVCWCNLERIFSEEAMNNACNYRLMDFCTQEPFLLPLTQT